MFKLMDHRFIAFFYYLSLWLIGFFQNSQSPLLTASTRQYSDVLKILLGDTEEEFMMPDLEDPIIGIL